jgi:hypothetical protein
MEILTSSARNAANYETLCKFADDYCLVLFLDSLGCFYVSISNMKHAMVVDKQVLWIVMFTALEIKFWQHRVI